MISAVNGLVIVTGCSHSGICNILLNTPEPVTGENRLAIATVGFHLLNASDTVLSGTE
uniref:Uncharacterized protein n=1 Tax=Escherichia coli TaxID=562 RepID=A0A7U1E1Y3_ECOLX|nr:hypothetical protein [Escherichia coli]